MRKPSLQWSRSFIYVITEYIGSSQPLNYLLYKYLSLRILIQVILKLFVNPYDNTLYSSYLPVWSVDIQISFRYYYSIIDCYSIHNIFIVDFIVLTYDDINLIRVYICTVHTDVHLLIFGGHKRDKIEMK